LHRNHTITFAVLVALAATSCDVGTNTPIIIIPPSVSAGYSHACAIDVDGTARCWGSNRYGELGIGSTDTLPHATPVKVGGLPKVALISAGQNRTCALSVSGAAFCWGRNSFGALGAGDTVTHTSPTAVSGGQTFTSISTGWNHTCARSGTGLAYCWGYGVYGQLGNGTNVSSSTPQQVSGSLTFTSISPGETHTCGTADGAAYCWGYNAHGAIGSGNPTDTKLDPTLISGGHDIAVVRAGFRYSCGVGFGTSSATYCWGMNLYGTLGASTPQTCLGFSDDMFPCSVTPVEVQGIPALSYVAVGTHHSCGIGGDGLAYCWGTNLAGELGRGTPSSAVQPAGPVSGSLAYSLISVGDRTTCGITVNGAIYCWGSNATGAIGDGTTTDAPAPTRVIFPPQ